MSDLDIELCRKKIGNNFEVILVAAARTRELRIKTTDRPTSNIMQAFIDIQSGLVGRERRFGPKIDSKSRVRRS